jgi:hypothetical protein
MKRIVAACSFLIFLAACKEPAVSPTVVLNDMFAAMKKGDIMEMKKFITKTDLALLEGAEKFMTSIDPQGIKEIKERMTEELKKNAQQIQYRLQNEKIDGDHATVEAEIITKDSVTLNGEKITKQTFELVKEDNSWKIALTKPGNEMFNSMKGNMGTQKGNLKNGIDRLKQMDPDSLKMLIRKGVEALDSLKK